MTGTQQKSAVIFDASLRLALTGVILVLLWLGLRLIAISRLMPPDNRYSIDHHLSARDLQPATLEEQRARFPLPIYPGAQSPEFGEMEFNGHPFFRCDYDVTASAEDILHYYRVQMTARGWSDTSEETIRQATMIQNPEQQGVLDFQNETFLRYYDSMMRSQATFSRHGGTVSIAVKEGAQSWLTRVGITYIEYSSPQELSRDLGRSIGLDGYDVDPTAPATFSQNLGGQKAETTILISRSTPADFRDELVRTYIRDGWKELVFPQSPNAAEHGQVACLSQDKAMLFMNIRYDAERDISRALISTIRSGSSPK